MELSANVDLDSLTLDTFQATTGHRFRMTKDQKARAIKREEALAEFIASERTARYAARPTVAAVTPSTAPATTVAPSNSQN